MAKKLIEKYLSGGHEKGEQQRNKATNTIQIHVYVFMRHGHGHGTL